MSLTITRNTRQTIIQKSQDTLEKLSDLGLSVLAKDNIDARKLLVLRNQCRVRLAAHIIKQTYGVNKSLEELISDAIPKLLKSNTWKNYDKRKSEVPVFITIVSMNAMRTELSRRTERFLQFPANEENNPWEEEQLVDPYAKDLNKSDDLPEMEEILRVLKDCIKFTRKRSFTNRAQFIQQIIELAYGIDLGTNPDLKELEPKQIAEQLKIKHPSLRTLIHRFKKIARPKITEELLEGRRFGRANNTNGKT